MRPTRGVARRRPTCAPDGAQGRGAARLREAAQHLAAAAADLRIRVAQAVYQERHAAVRHKRLRARACVCVCVCVCGCTHTGSGHSTSIGEHQQTLHARITPTQ
jgi:hypothetical protein